MYAIRSYYDNNYQMTKISRLILATILTFSGFVANAQNSTTISLNPDVRHGVLSNGMHYYILHNEEPKERVSLYFVQNVGAILEDDSQDGLAHFLEHMAFNGLKNYPGKGMLNYLEANGIAFGREINAVITSYSIHYTKLYDSTIAS